MAIENRTVKNRWLMMLSAIGIHISIGSVYAFSVITDPVKTVFDVESTTIKWAFQITILMMGFSAAFLGEWVSKIGPKKSTTLAGICYSLGIIGTGIAIHLESLSMFFVSYGIIAGIGLGVGYITPVSVLVKWFPDRRGLAVGIVVMAFGLSSLIFGPLMQYLFESIEITTTFYILGAIYALFIMLSALYIENPPEGYVPEGYKPDKKDSKSFSLSEITGKQALKSNRFYLIWFMMFINISCGIALISEASPIAQQQLGYTPMQAAGIVGLIGAFNGLGRLFWSAFSDYFGRPKTFIIFFVIEIFAFYLLAQVGYPAVFIGLLMLIISIFGGAFATLPAFLSDLFGTKQLGTILGMVLISKGFAGLFGPSLYNFIIAETGSLNTTLKVFSGLFVLALVLSILLYRSVNSAYEQVSLSER
jgi:OFA family oxalate/formate antiporter-like MFS transporter